jgi:hypothetical protein
MNNIEGKVYVAIRRSIHSKPNCIDNIVKTKEQIKYDAYLEILTSPVNNIPKIYKMIRDSCLNEDNI